MAKYSKIFVELRFNELIKCVKKSGRFSVWLANLVLNLKYKWNNLDVRIGN